MNRGILHRAAGATRQICQAAVAVGILALVAEGSRANAEDLLQNGDLIAICGDSITEQKLYTRYIEEYLLMCQPIPDVQVAQFGWAGETAYNFKDRQASSCLIFRPTVATVLYGMNDAGYAPDVPGRLEGYKTSIGKIIRAFREAGVNRIVLSSPTVVDIGTFKKTDPAVYNKVLANFGDAAKAIADEHGVVFADVHKVMMEVMGKAKEKYGATYALASDGVHPGPNGQILIAYVLLKAMGCKGDIGTITVDLKNNAARATEGHKVLSKANGSVELESTRYPFCFSGDEAQASARTIVESFPFHEDLNRFKLIVTNGGSPRLKVTWGSNSRIYDAADLENGINLAAAFPDNPFSESFGKVEKAIIQQQNYETVATKTLLLSLQKWREYFPDEKETFKRLQQQVVEKATGLRLNSRAAVTPVKHNIKIEPER